MNATNQQLAFARVQVQAAVNASSPLARRAHWQAGVFQLHGALEAYAAELQESAKVRFSFQSGPGMFTRLLQRFEADGMGSTALAELAQLEQDPGSWLSLVQQWNASLLNLGADRSSSSVLAETSLTQQQLNESSGTIKLVDADATPTGPPPFSASAFEDAVSRAAELFERQRSNNIEY